MASRALTLKLSLMACRRQALRLINVKRERHPRPLCGPACRAYAPLSLRLLILLSKGS